MSENNLFPPDNPRARKRGRRAKRPAHLPPYVPDAIRPENEAKAKKQLSAAPAAAAFGAKRGAGNALLFHQLKTSASPATPAASESGSESSDDVRDDED